MYDDWNKDNKTILTLQMGEEKCQWEVSAPCNDVPIEDIIQAFYAQLISYTYTPASVMRALRNFVDEHQRYVDPDYEDEEEYCYEGEDEIDCDCECECDKTEEK